MVQAVHTVVHGRARYKVKGLYRSDSLKKRLESRLSEVEGIEAVSANILTGNLLVLFNSGNAPSDIASLIQEVVSHPPSSGSAADRRGVRNLNTRAEIQSAEPWHRMETETVLALFGSRVLGLTEEGAKERLHRYGPNLLPEGEPRSKWRLFFDQFRSLPVVLPPPEPPS